MHIVNCVLHVIVFSLVIAPTVADQVTFKRIKKNALCDLDVVADATSEESTEGGCADYCADFGPFFSWRERTNECRCYTSCDNTPNHQEGVDMYQIIEGTAAAGGDPHFRTWNGEKFDFHGGCDLVLLKNTNFAGGRGLNVHIRTSIKTWWSFIKHAAVQIGDDTLEIKGSGHKQVTYWINGVETPYMKTGDTTLGNYAVHFERVNPHQSQTWIDLGNYGDAITIETFREWVRVNIKDKKHGAFQGSLGLLGSYETGEKVARDSVTVVEDANTYGQEWQVLDTEPKLFHAEGVVQHPVKCVIPDVTQKRQRRRLGESLITKEDAALACANVEEAWNAACIYDVMATNDKEMAGMYLSMIHD